MMQRLSKGSKKRRAMTLVELAIVLGVMGLVGAAIWAAASAVRARQPIDDTASLVSDIASNVANIYTGFSATAVPPATVAGQITAGLYPQAVVNSAGTDTVNAWGGTILIHFEAPPTGFSIEFTLPASLTAIARREACIGMVTRLQGSATNYAGGVTASALPSAAVSLDATQSSGPALTLVNTGSWTNVTGNTTISNLFGATGTTDCTGFAFYYRM